MKQDQEQTPKQIHSLTLTPELRQSLFILQMPVMELENYISQQLLENCLLEQQDPIQDDHPEEEFTLNAPELKNDENNPPYDNHDLLYETLSPETIKINSAEGIQYYQNLKTSLPTLQDYLLSQLHLSALAEKENVIAEFLIGNIDEDGYLRIEIEQVAQVINISIEQVEKILQLIQTFDPPGIGARDLRECLLLQLNSMNDSLSRSLSPELFQIAKSIIEDHLYDIADGKIPKIAIQLKQSVKAIQTVTDMIRQLDPKPGRNFGDFNDTRFITPDITIKKSGLEYMITIHEPANAKLTIQPTYRKLLQKQEQIDENTWRFLKEKENAALQLMKSIEQRKKTIYKITEAIISIQHSFFEKGPQILIPLTLRQVAETIGVHESTVSRAIADKYVDTPRGIFPMKYFFNARLESRMDDNVSSAMVKKQIKEAIDRENPNAPLSDQQLVNILNENGIMVSRRTITKYREDMEIPSSIKRRRY